MSNKVIGKFHEKRGDDYYEVFTDPDGEVILITQRDSIRRTYPSINFWAAEAPKMIALIQKAAGIKEPKVKYEYAVQITDHTGFVVSLHEYDWRTIESAKELLDLRLRRWKKAGIEYTAKIVRRVQAGKIEDV
jgi:hypothetical protein